MGPPMLVGSAPNQTMADSDPQYSGSEGHEGDGSQSGELMHQIIVGTDDGIKYAKMPPALRPERPKKGEKQPKGAKALPPPQTVSSVMVCPLHSSNATLIILL
jgi:hypothetical protein